MIDINREYLYLYHTIISISKGTVLIEYTGTIIDFLCKWYCWITINTYESQWKLSYFSALGVAKKTANEIIKT